MDQFFDLTAAQLQEMIYQISVRRHNDMANQAQIHGHKAKFMRQREEIFAPIETSKDEETALEDAATERFEQLSKKSQKRK